MHDPHDELTAGDVMHAGCLCVPAGASLVEASQIMVRENVGALPVCGEDDRLVGMLTDRDIVVSCVAEGLDPGGRTAGQTCTGPIIWAREEAGARELLTMMEENRIRRLPVIDEHRKLVGIVSVADIAKRMDREAAGEVIAVTTGDF
jgi:CBS domain-containing protein